MSSSRSALKVSFNVSIELMPKQTDDPDFLDLDFLDLDFPLPDDYQVATWNIASHFPNPRERPLSELIGPSFDFSDIAAGLPNPRERPLSELIGPSFDFSDIAARLPNPRERPLSELIGPSFDFSDIATRLPNPRERPLSELIGPSFDFSDVAAGLPNPRERPLSELIGPSFDFSDVAAGLPEVKAAVDAARPGSCLHESFTTNVRVGVQGGISGGETTLFAKKITTLAMVLDIPLLTKLVARFDDVHRVSRESQVAMGPWPQGNVISSDYDSHVPPIATMKPAIWNKRDPEWMYRQFSLIWSAPSLWELKGLLDLSPAGVCDFYFRPPRDLPASRIPWSIEETPRDPSPWWRPAEEFGPPRESSNRLWDSEESYTYFHFTYLQSTFEHKLLHDWVEVIVRIVELALASSDEYKRCLETIFTILHDDIPDEFPDDIPDEVPDEVPDNVAWEKLMKRILKLEHRIPEWRDRISKYRYGISVTNPAEDGLLSNDIDMDLLLHTHLWS